MPKSNKDKHKGSKHRSKPVRNKPLSLARQWRNFMTAQIMILHEESLLLMLERGILPPFYGNGAEVDENEVFPVWGSDEQGNDEIALLFLRITDFAEPNDELDEARREMGLSNELSVKDVFASIQGDQPIQVEGGALFDTLLVTLTVIGSQIEPIASAWSLAETFEHMRDGLPYAVIVQVPISGHADDEDFNYRWDDLDEYKVMILCAHSSEELEIVVWQYRLDLALAVPVEQRGKHVTSVPSNAPAELPTTIAELAALFDLNVNQAMRYYGVTSPIAAKQHSLDVMREDDDHLVVYPPLKIDIEPSAVYQQQRAMLNAMPPDTTAPVTADSAAAETPLTRTPLLRVNVWSKPYRDIWTEVRAFPYFSLRIYADDTSPDKQPQIDWLTEKTLPRLYARTALSAIGEMLATLDFSVRYGQPPDEEGDMDALLAFMAENGIELPNLFDLFGHEEDEADDD